MATALRTRASETAPAPLPTFAGGPTALVAGVVGVVLTVLSPRYGFHRDELYFLSSGARPDWGYVDQPPLVPMLARVTTELFGATPAGLRVAATLLCVTAVVTAALVARETGADRGGQVLAAAATAATGIVLAFGHTLGTVTVDLLVWLLIVWLALRLLRTGRGIWYLPIGLVTGIGLQSKDLVALLVLALGAAVLALGPRRVLATWWLPAGAVLALAIAAPNLVWQAAHGWPMLTVASGISASGGWSYRAQLLPLQIGLLSPFLAPLLVAGVVRPWREPALVWARAVPVAYGLVLLAVLVAGGRPYYPLPMAVAVMAIGAQPVLVWVRRRRSRRRLLVAGVALAAVINVLAVLPVLPPAALTIPNAVSQNQGEQLGWPEMTAKVAGAWSALPPAERDRAVVFTQNTGEAAALEHYGPATGLPRPYSGHMSFADWGAPPDTDDGPVLVVNLRGLDPPQQRAFVDCRPVDTIRTPGGIANFEQGYDISSCRGTAAPWSVLWPGLRHYY